jgi:hypothetical protein
MRRSGIGAAACIAAPCTPSVMPSAFERAKFSAEMS